MEGGNNFPVHLNSDASMRHFPENSITNFRTKLAMTIPLEYNEWEVALTECSYMPSDIFIRKGDLIGTAYTKTHTKEIDASWCPVGENKRKAIDGVESDIISPKDFRSMQTFLNYLKSLTCHDYVITDENYIE